MSDKTLADKSQGFLFIKAVWVFKSSDSLGTYLGA